MLCHSLILGSGATGFASARTCEYRPLRSTGGASGTLIANCDKALERISRRCSTRFLSERARHRTSADKIASRLTSRPLSSRRAHADGGKLGIPLQRPSNCLFGVFSVPMREINPQKNQRRAPSHGQFMSTSSTALWRFSLTER